MEILNEILTFIYSIAHLIGTGVAKFLKFIFTNIEIPINIVDSIGFLAVITLFLILVQAAKKVAWIIVIVGWVLILIRLIIVIF